MKVVAYLCLVALAVLADLPAPERALGADMEARRPPPPAPVNVPPPFTWSGFYIGGNLGGAWAQPAFTDSVYGLTFPTGASKGAFVGGGQVGFNLQSGSLVFGLEAEFEGIASRSSGPGVLDPTNGHLIQVASNDRWLTAIAARIGAVPVSNFLIYGKAGGGWVGDNGFTITDVTTGSSFAGAASSTRAGWLVGMGVEWAFTNNWTARFDWDYLGLNTRTVVIPPGTSLPPDLIGDAFTGNRSVQTLKVELNYLFNFGPWPVAARY